jgi:arylsulfatase A-like enzyme
MSLAPRAVVISFDHWHLGFVGCYGNDWIETPHLDRLASQAVTFDRHFSDNIDESAANHAWWTGRLQFPLGSEQQRRCQSWCAALHAAGVKTHLVIESDGGEDSTVAPPFESTKVVHGADGFDVPENETPFACTVHEIERMLNRDAGKKDAAVLWIKSRGIPTPWTPPEIFSDLYLEEFGLAQGEDSEGRSREEAEEDDDDGEEKRGGTDSKPAAENNHVDESLDWRYAGAMYAAYATLVDRWFGKLLQFLDESSDWNQALVVVTAGAGAALGEHGRLMDERAPLRAESVHAPLWIRLPDREHAGTRRSAIVQTCDVGPTLLDWFSVPPDHVVAADCPGEFCGYSLLPLVRNELDAIREFAWVGSGRTEWGLRTDEFFYLEAGDQECETDVAREAALFEKPHDRWDQFNVLSQFGQVATDLHEILNPLRAK